MGIRSAGSKLLKPPGHAREVPYLCCFLEANRVWTPMSTQRPRTVTWFCCAACGAEKGEIFWNWGLTCPRRYLQFARCALWSSRLCPLGRERGCSIAEGDSRFDGGARSERRVPSIQEVLKDSALKLKGTSPLGDGTAVYERIVLRVSRFLFPVSRGEAVGQGPCF